MAICPQCGSDELEAIDGAGDNMFCDECGEVVEVAESPEDFDSSILDGVDDPWEDREADDEDDDLAE